MWKMQEIPRNPEVSTTQMTTIKRIKTTTNKHVAMIMRDGDKLVDGQCSNKAKCVGCVLIALAFQNNKLHSMKVW